MSNTAPASIDRFIQAMACQIDAISAYALLQTSALTAEELSFLLGALKRAEIAVGDQLGEVLGNLPDSGRAAS